jgi:hypothetical protein
MAWLEAGATRRVAGSGGGPIARWRQAAQGSLVVSAASRDSVDETMARKMGPRMNAGSRPGLAADGERQLGRLHRRAFATGFLLGAWGLSGMAADRQRVRAPQRGAAFGLPRGLPLRSGPDCFSRCMGFPGSGPGQVGAAAAPNASAVVPASASCAPSPDQRRDRATTAVLTVHGVSRVRRPGISPLVRRTRAGHSGGQQRGTRSVGGRHGALGVVLATF